MYIGRIGRVVRAPVRVGSAETAEMKSALYRRFYPYHAELCALSEIRKRPGFGAEFGSGAGGHSLLYLNGVCVDRSSGYPVLRVCDELASAADHGVGISVNSHYRNANWVAVEGRDFVFGGALNPCEALTRSSYARTQERARAIGVLDGIEFHDYFFRDKPGYMSQLDYMYDISVGTDYAVRFGRDVYRAKVPLDRQRMESIVTLLNALNAPYRDGQRIYRWRLFNDNCSHVAHNALATAGIWAPWPTGQFFAFAAVNFPVPKNEFVDLVLRVNDLPVDDPRAMYADAIVRRALLEMDIVPTAPGGLVSVDRAIAENEVYETERLRLIFYANPFWGRYHRHFARIFREPRYFDLRTNLRFFAALYKTARDNLPAVGGHREMAQFLARYEAHVERTIAQMHDQLDTVAGRANGRAEAVS